jgi:hypothetical protein
VQQLSDSGRNKIDRQTQTNLLAATVLGAPSALIQQGSGSGGIDSTQDQESSGLSSIVDSQRSDQVAAVRNITSSTAVDQIEDPRCCAAGHQIGNAGTRGRLRRTPSAYGERVVVDGEQNLPTSIRPARLRELRDGRHVRRDLSVSTNTESETNSCSASSCDIGVVRGQWQRATDLDAPPPARSRPASATIRIARQQASQSGMSVTTSVAST